VELDGNFHTGYPLFSSDLNQTLIFSTNFRKIIKHKIFMKVVEVGAELFHADRRADRRTDVHDEANSRFFCNFANSPKTSDSFKA